MASKWIEHVKAYAKKHKISYKESMSKAKASYKPVKKGGAMSGYNSRGIKPLNLERKIGGAKMMKLPELKKQVKEMGHSLSKVVNGVRKAYNKKELLTKLVENAEMKGGKFSFSKLGKDALNISKKIVRTGVPAMAGIGTTIETGNPMAGLAAAKGASELTNYITGGRMMRGRRTKLV